MVIKNDCEVTENTLVVVKWSQITNFNLTVKWKPESPVFSAKKEECADYPNLWQKYLNKILEGRISLCVRKKQVVTCLTSFFISLINPVWTLNVGGSLDASGKLFLQSRNSTCRVKLEWKEPRYGWIITLPKCVEWEVKNQFVSYLTNLFTYLLIYKK